MPRADYDIVVIGGGHAGAEAAWAASRLDASVALVTLDPRRVGQMSCNPAIGGLAKGQMVREVDALGGLMALATDAAGIQFRMLNRSKGPAVWGPRAQADKYKYAREVQRLLGTCRGVTIVPGEVAEIVVEGGGTKARRHEGTKGEVESDNRTREPSGFAAGCAAEQDAHPASPRRVTGVRLADGTRLTCRAVVVGSGTFLRGLMHTGERQTEGGRVGESAARGLSGCLAKLGLELGRLKTGTPPRLKRDTIDFSKFEVQPGDDEPAPFSYLNEYAPAADEATGSQSQGLGEPRWSPPLRQVNCWIGATNEAIHEIIRANLHRAPMYSGQIGSTGPRYCPSIEDKVVRFADKASHHIFLEPEGLDTDEIYCNGISTSLPADVQEQIVRLDPGLERAADPPPRATPVEYDMVGRRRSARRWRRSASRAVPGGQINGTSGLRGSAAQGLVAG
jgi:tRNA uridine 5-carboxymethylaminomethyl modification enzyme